jgi:hypothetical protein
MSDDSKLYEKMGRLVVAFEELADTNRNNVSMISDTLQLLRDLQSDKVRLEDVRVTEHGWEIANTPVTSVTGEEL